VFNCQYDVLLRAETNLDITSRTSISPTSAPSAAQCIKLCKFMFSQSGCESLLISRNFHTINITTNLLVFDCRNNVLFRAETNLDININNCYHTK